MAGYFCKQCGLAVIVTKGGKIIRACKCDAPVIAGMSATATGESKVEHGKTPA